MIEPHYIREAVTAVGLDRALCGSNGPAGRPAVQIGVIQHAELAVEEERAVLGENPVRRLRLA